MSIKDKLKKISKEAKYQITGKRPKKEWKADFSDKFKEDYGDLPEDIQEEIREAIREVMEDPYKGELIEDEEDD